MTLGILRGYVEDKAGDESFGLAKATTSVATNSGGRSQDCELEFKCSSDR